MSWDQVKDWLPVALAAVPNIVLAVQWAMRKEFATTDTVVSVHKVLDDQIREQSDRITTALHRIDLMEKDMKGLPDYDTTNEIKEDLGSLKIKQAENGTELRLVSEKLDRLDDFLRSNSK